MRGAFLGIPGEGGGSRSHYNSGYHGPGFSVGLPLVACRVLFQSGHYSYAREIQYEYKHNYNRRVYLEVHRATVLKNNSSAITFVLFRISPCGAWCLHQHVLVVIQGDVHVFALS